MGLMESDELWRRTFQDAANEMTSTRQKRRFFARMLHHSAPRNARALFQMFLPDLAPEYDTDEERIHCALCHLNFYLSRWNKTVKDFNLGEVPDYDEAAIEALNDFRRDPNANTDTEDDPFVSWADEVRKAEAEGGLNDEQRVAYESIKAALQADRNDG
jgi:hypothetical protein